MSGYEVIKGQLQMLPLPPPPPPPVTGSLKKDWAEWGSSILDEK